MEIFSSVLHGSYVYLLILQILVVTSLFLLLVWLIAQRVKAAGESVTSEVAVAGAIPATAATGIDEKAYQEVVAKFQELQAQYDQIKSETTEVQPLHEKIRFLESKLLEYEILQEEISTLGTLKLENEKLKADLVRVGGPESVPAGGEGEKTEAPSPEPAMSVAPESSEASAAPAATVASDNPMEGLIEQIEQISKTG